MPINDPQAGGNPVNATQLRAFHEVGTAGSFTAAAAVMHVSQPTLSEHVGSLERSYGVTLFSRRGRNVALTPLGTRLLEITRRMSDLDLEAAACLREARELTSGHLRLGADAPMHAMPLLAAFLRRHPGVRVSLACGNRDGVLADLLAHRVDAALVSDVEDDGRLAAVPLVHDRFVAVVPRADSLADRGRVRLAELTRRRLIVREAGSGTRRVLDTALAEIGTFPDETLEVDSREAAIVAVAMGIGVAVAGASEVPQDVRIVTVPIVGPVLRSTGFLACLAGRADTTLLRATLAAAREGVADRPT